MNKTRTHTHMHTHTNTHMVYAKQYYCSLNIQAIFWQDGGTLDKQNNGGYDETLRCRLDKAPAWEYGRYNTGHSYIPLRSPALHSSLRLFVAVEQVRNRAYIHHISVAADTASLLHFSGPDSCARAHPPCDTFLTTALNRATCPRARKNYAQKKNNGAAEVEK